MNKKNNNRHKKNKTNRLAKLLVENGYLFVLSFVLSTGLISGSGYLLFQLPIERNSLERQISDFRSSGSEYTSFNNMSDVYLTGWFSDKNQQQHTSDVLAYLGSNISSGQLDQTFTDGTLDWISKSLPILSSEKGRIDGFVFTNEIERGVQQNMVSEYDNQIAFFDEMDGLIRNWKNEQPADRDKYLASMQQSALDSMSTLQSTLSKLSQLNTQVEVDKQNAQQKSNDLSSQVQIIWLKTMLSIAGVILGVLTLVFLTSLAINKKRIS